LSSIINQSAHAINTVRSALNQDARKYTSSSFSYTPGHPTGQLALSIFLQVLHWDVRLIVVTFKTWTFRSLEVACNVHRRVYGVKRKALGLGTTQEQNVRGPCSCHKMVFNTKTRGIRTMDNQCYLDVGLLPFHAEVGMRTHLGNIVNCFALVTQSIPLFQNSSNP
jgi:hypothetical protein